MSNSKPIGYDSLQYVFKNMDPSLRYDFIKRCPSLANLDRRIPIQVRDLHIDRSRFKINDTTYTIGVVQIFRNERTPRCIEQHNNNGGVLMDVDRYGIDATRRWNAAFGEEERIFLLQQLERLMRVARTHEEFQRVQEVREQLRLQQMRRIANILRSESADPPFDHYLQFMVESDRGVRRERLNYNRTVIEAKDYVLNKLFGGAGRRVEVFKLHYGFDLSGNNHNIPNRNMFNNHNPAPVPNSVRAQLRNPLLPLAPGNLKLHHLNILFNVRKVIASIQPILWDQPLKSLETYMQEIPERVRQDPFAASMERIIISGRSTIGILSEFLNEKVHIQCCDFGEDEVKDLVREWQNRGLRTGKYYSIGFRHPRNIEDLLNLFKEIPGAMRGELAETRFTDFPECVILPVRPLSELNVYCEATTIEDQKFCDRPFTVKMKVQPKGYAYNLYLPL